LPDAWSLFSQLIIPEGGELFKGVSGKEGGGELFTGRFFGDGLGTVFAVFSEGGAFVVGVGPGAAGAVEAAFLIHLSQG
jgi:hypothetical protein